MNERIQKLVVESGNGQMHDGKLYPHIGSRTEADWKKFAELIVRECADLCESFGESGDGYTCSAEILEHFGVKE